jgi:sugar phosphate permease
MGTTSSVFLLQAYRVGLGLSEGPLGIGCTNVINRWFPAKEKGTATELWIAASKLGPLIVPSVCIVVMQLWGWREGIGFAGYSAYPMGLATESTYPTAFGVVNCVGPQLVAHPFC